MKRFIATVLAYTFVACATVSPSASVKQHDPKHHHSKHDSSKKGHHHSFEDAAKWAQKFEDPERDSWQQPEVVIEALELSTTDIIADIGSATGYFPVRLAGLVAEGRVWGVDVEPDMVRYLNRRARDSGMDNLFSILGSASDPLLPEAVSRVLIVDTYHHISDRVAYLENLKQYLSDGAQVVVVDFKKDEKIPFGPPPKMRMSHEQVAEEFRQAGYRTLRVSHALPYQYISVFGLDTD